MVDLGSDELNKILILHGTSYTLVIACTTEYLSSNNALFTIFWSSEIFV